MSARASALLAARTIVQFPRNPILLGFSFVPVLMMFLVFGALFEGVTRLPGFPTDNYFEYLAPTAILLTTVPGIGNAAVALASDFQSRYVYKLLTAPISIGSIVLGRLLGDSVRLVRAGGRRPRPGDRARRARRDRHPRRRADDPARDAARASSPSAC